MLPTSPDSAPSATPRPVNRILNPNSIAIIGASADPRSFGGFLLGNLERFGFAGAIHLVSRGSSQINGRACVAAIDELPAGVDVAVLAIPQAGVLDAIRGLAAKRVGAAVIFASGYAEAGAAGQQAQAQLRQAADAGGLLLVGPNCMGLTNFEAGIPLTFEPLEPYPCQGRPGIAVLAQSGAMACNMRDAFQGRHLPITAAVSTGNEASLGIEDYLAHFIADPQSRLIAIYAEQIRRPPLFLQLARQARAAGKPIVLLMPGKSERARAAAQSHTGALASDHAVAATLLRREAVVVVDSLDELFDTAALLLRFPKPPALGPAFVTNSGAMKNIALDFADDIGLSFPELNADTTEQLVKMLPSYAVAENPLDYTTISIRDPGLIGTLIDTVLADPNVGSAVMCMMGGPPVAQKDKADYVLPALARATKPTALIIMGDNVPLEPVLTDALRESGLPFFRSPDRALRALARVSQFGEALLRAERSDRSRTKVRFSGRVNESSNESSNQSLNQPSIEPSMATDRTGQRLPEPKPANGIYPEYQGKQWLAQLGLAIPAGELAKTFNDAERIATRIGYPVVLKAQASELPHKSDAGGVIINIADQTALSAAWERLHQNVREHRPQLRLDGVLVEAMGARGIELVVGGKRDPEWGPLVLVGLGGIWIEALKDVRLLACDTTVEDIVAELRQLQAAAVLNGARGEPAVDLHAIAQVVALIGGAMLAQPQILEIDINPLVATAKASKHPVLALDALIVVARV